MGMAPTRVSNLSPSESAATAAHGQLPAETVSRREHDEGIRLEGRLKELETKMGHLYWLGGVILALGVGVAVRLIWVAAGGG